MTSHPISIDINASYHEIEKLFVEHSISTLLVKDKDQIVGLVRANSLLA
jgi:predicted transcriptional regulator